MCLTLILLLLLASIAIPFVVWSWFVTGPNRDKSFVRQFDSVSMLVYGTVSIIVSVFVEYKDILSGEIALAMGFILGRFVIWLVRERLYLKACK